LLVDDEPGVLTVLERLLRATVDCDVTKAAGGAEALRILEARPFDIVISDMAMPGMSGAEFLDMVQELHPRTMRMILSGRSSREQGLQTVGSVHQYFLKPSDVASISKRLGQVLKRRELLPEEGLGAVIAKVDTLPSPPDIYLALEREIVKPEASAEDIGRIVQTDLAMSAKVLQLVNSAFFGLRERVSSPAQAVALLGADLLKSLVLAVHVFSAVPKADPREGFVKSLWSHSLSVATAAREIALFESAAREAVEDAYVSGLFHDIGKLVIAMHLPDAHNHIDRLVGRKGETAIEAERAAIGTTHAEVGGYLLALWGFADTIVETVVFHENPAQTNADGKGFSTLAAVHVANVFDHEKAASNGGRQARLDEAFLTRLGLGAKPAAWRDAVA
jgi:HD-like signal output (HDOD) protein/CheY-like chemotaxis protein